MATKAKKAAPPNGVSVRVSPELRRRVKVYAAKSGRSILSVADEALAAYLKDKSA